MNIWNFFRKKPDWPQLIIDSLLGQIAYLTAEVEYYRKREEKALNALLTYENKPAITQPDTNAALDFVDKSFSMFIDTEGGKEVVS